MLKRFSILISLLLLFFVGSFNLSAQCPAPDTLEVSDVTATTAEISWVVIGVETLWDFELVDITAGGAATGNATSTGITANPYSMTGLTPDNDYEIYVRANCGPLNTPPTSDWEGPISFSTDPTCFPVTDLEVTDVDTNYFEISWTAGGSESQWNIEMVNTTQGGSLNFVPTENGVTTTSFTFDNLDPGQDFQVIVQADCGGLDGVSAWTDTLFVSTDDLCIIPGNITLGGVSSDEATVNWVGLDNETSWAVEIINTTLLEVQQGIPDFFAVSETYTFTGLLPENEYSVFVQAQCGGSDGDSEWSEAISFTTFCAPYALPYTEEFSVWPFDCFTIENNGIFLVNGFGTVTSSPGPAVGHATITSPLIDNTGASRVFFEWSHLPDPINHLDTLALYGSYDNGANWNLLWEKNGLEFNSYDGANANNPGTYKNEYVPLPPAYDNNEVLLRFRFGSGGGTPNDVDITRMGVELMPDCNYPYNIDITNVTETSADIDFEVYGTSLNWEYQLLPSLQAPTNTPTGTLTTNSFSLSSLTAGTAYDLYFKTNCTVDSTDWDGPYTFVTDCAILTDIYQGFESVPNADIPMCWTRMDNDGQVGVINNSANAVLGDRYLRMISTWNVSGNNLDLALVSPEISNLNGGTHWLRFWASNNLGASVNIGTMSDPTDISTFTNFETVTPTTTYQEYSVDFSGYIGSDNYLAIQLNAPAGNATVNIDELKWQEIPTCFVPEEVTITDINIDNVTANVTPYNIGDNMFEVSLVNVSNGEGFNGTVTDTINGLSEMLTGLDPGSFYNLYIRTVCGAGDESEWSWPYPFATHCIATDTLNESFETTIPINGLPACWTKVVSSEALGSVEVNASSANTGINALDINTFWGTTADENFSLVSPVLSNIGDGTHWLKFYAKKPWAWSGNPTLRVGTITDPMDPTTFDEILSFSITSNFYQEFTVPFVSYTGAGDQIVFRLDGGGNASFTVEIDDVLWEEAPECADVTGVDTAGLWANEAEITWLPVSPDTTWYLEIVDITALEAFTGTATDTSLTTNYTFDNLVENNVYDVYVKSSCTGSGWVGPFTFVTLWENNVGVTEIIAPAEEGCGLTATNEVVVELINSGGNMQPDIPVEYSWDLTNWLSAGSYTDTLYSGETVEYTFPFTLDFENANGLVFYVRTLLPGDSDDSDDSQVVAVTNNGEIALNLEVYSGAQPWEIQIEISDSITGTQAFFMNGNPWNNFETYNIDVCLDEGTTYLFEANDTQGDGWESGTYELTSCGIVLANNGGVVPDNGINAVGLETEASEYFSAESCSEYDLTVESIGGPYSGCGLDTNEVFDITITNNGVLDIDSADAELEIDFNGAGFVTISNFPTGLAAGASITIQTDSLNLGTVGEYIIDVNVDFATDENPGDNTMSFTVVNAPTLTSETQDFDTNNGLWATDHVEEGVSSWEWGVAGSTILSSGGSGNIWATGLNADLVAGEVSYLVSPCYDFSGYAFAPEVRYDYVFDAGSAAVALQVSTNGGANWSNIEAIAGTTTWEEGLHLLTTFIGESDVKFRWKLDAGNANNVEGFGFDNWEVVEHTPYTDATLSDLTVDGTTVTGFSSTTYTYTVMLPFGATTIPSVNGVPNAAIVNSITYDNATIPLPDTTFVTVIAEDTLFTQVYEVIFEEEPPSSNNDLSMITVDGTNIAGFNASITSYNYSVPFGGAVPTIGATVADPTATLSITQATGLPGTATITVTAQDGTTQDYTVNITEDPPSSNAFLSNLTIDGTTVTGFAPSIINYTANSFASPLPIIAGTVADPTATITSVVQVPSIPGSATITVTAQDGVTTMTYTVTFNLLLNINADLAGIDVNGSPLAGFGANILNYTMHLPFGAPVPVVVPTLDDPLASFVVNNAIDVPGTTTIVVTAENGVVIKTYTIVWTEALPNNDSHLTSLTLGIGTVGSMTPSFSPNTLEYLICLGDGNPPVPNINVVLSDPNATYQIIPPAAVPGDLEVIVTAEDGVSVTTYTLKLRNCDPLSLEEEGFDFALYPNPTPGYLMIQSNATSEDFRIELINQLGRVVLSKDQTTVQLNDYIELDDLANGVYTFRLYMDSKVYTEKITIMK
jgi:hypothetical protein